jgi:hypothetical protein
MHPYGVRDEAWLLARRQQARRGRQPGRDRYVRRPPLKGHHRLRKVQRALRFSP